MKKLVDKRIVTNKHRASSFSVATLFLARDQKGYNWLHQNSSVESRSSRYTNDLDRISKQPRMVSINSAIGIDLHGNIWADSLAARRIYSGMGGAADFARGVTYRSNPGNWSIIAMKSTSSNGRSKVYDMCPKGITTTAIPSDQVVLVTEHGALAR